MTVLYRPRRAFVEAVGRMFNRLGGGLLTRLTAPLAPGDDVAQVESTYSFPESGVVATSSCT